MLSAKPDFIPLLVSLISSSAFRDKLSTVSSNNCLNWTGSLPLAVILAHSPSNWSISVLVIIRWFLALPATLPGILTLDAA